MRGKEQNREEGEMAQKKLGGGRNSGKSREKEEIGGEKLGGGRNRGGKLGGGRKRKVGSREN